jgi:ribosomal-protein-alanine N-acetyltransferase
MSEHVEFAPARPGDAAPIAQMSRRFIEQGLAWRWTPRSVAARIRDSDSIVLVARTSETLVGFAIMGFAFERSESHLLLLAVDPGQRRRGIGGALVHWLEKVARVGGIARIQLEVRAGNREACAFYRRLGFHEQARLRGYYERREDALRMVRSLARSRVGGSRAGGS